MPHFILYPADICFLPVTILFGYFHGFIKLWAIWWDGLGFRQKGRMCMKNEHRASRGRGRWIVERKEKGKGARVGVVRVL